MYQAKNVDRKMFYGAKPVIFERAKFLRDNMTECEKILWSSLNKNQLGVRFKPQHPVATFIVDFYCHKLSLVIEIDGDYHKFNSQYDRSRSDELEKYNLTIVRFKNEEILNDLNTVLLKIEKMITQLNFS
jgi:very-short-patch-repair endonuclease